MKLFPYNSVLVCKRSDFLLKYLGVGILIAIVAVLIGVVTGDWSLFMKIIGGAAIIPLLLSGIFVGAFVNGDQIRANFHTETKGDRKSRHKWVTRFLLISAPNLTLLIVLIAFGQIKI